MTKACMLFLILSMFHFSCRNTSLTDTEKKEIIQEVTSTLRAYVQEVSEGGLLREFKYLDSTADFYWIPPGYNSLLNFESIKHILIVTAPRIKGIQNTYENMKVFPVSENYANYTTIIRSTITDTSNQINNSKLIESGTLVKRKDGWKLLSGHTSILSQ